MKKLLLSAALISTTSFVGMASTLPAHVDLAANKSNTNMITCVAKPTALQCISPTVCGHATVICFDDAVEGDVDAAIDASIAYNCG